MNDLNVKELIAEYAERYNDCLEEVSRTINLDALSSVGVMSVTDLKDIATSIFIETIRQLNAEKTAKEPASEAQKTFIADLLTQKGKRAIEFMQKYLEKNDLEDGEQLTKEQASVIITELKKM